MFFFIAGLRDYESLNSRKYVILNLIKYTLKYTQSFYENT